MALIWGIWKRIFLFFSPFYRKYKNFTFMIIISEKLFNDVSRTIPSRRLYLFGRKYIRIIVKNCCVQEIFQGNIPK